LLPEPNSSISSRYTGPASDFPPGVADANCIGCFRLRGHGCRSGDCCCLARTPTPRAPHLGRGAFPQIASTPCVPPTPWRWFQCRPAPSPPLLRRPALNAPPRIGHRAAMTKEPPRSHQSAIPFFTFAQIAYLLIDLPIDPARTRRSSGASKSADRSAAHGRFRDWRIVRRVDRHPHRPGSHPPPPRTPRPILVFIPSKNLHPPPSQFRLNPR
jgi:hypothetical protein